MHSRALTPRVNSQLPVASPGSEGVPALLPGPAARAPGSFYLSAEVGARSIWTPFPRLSLDALAHPSPARGRLVLISLAVTCSSACLFSLSCHHTLSHSAPFSNLLCAERSISCISLFPSSLKPSLASVELGSPLSGSASISANVLHYSGLRNGFLLPLTSSAFHSNSATSRIPPLFSVNLTMLLGFSEAGRRS